MSDMIRMVVALTVFMMIPNMNAQEKIRWHTLEDAIELNSLEPRKFVVDVYTDWCGWCKRMDATTFSDATVAAYINEHFYPVKFNAEMKDSLTLGQRTYHFVENGGRGYHEVAAILTKGRLSYPTIVYLDEELRHIGVEPGYKTAAQLTDKLIYYKEEQYKAQQAPPGM
jgi:thioredoxin-related protein